MALDRALLERHGSFEDEHLGIRERFLQIDLASGRTLGVLSTPLGPGHPAGWVVCHSFGTEQTDLQMTEVAMARRIAAAGYPVVRFHCQGYGDSEDLDTPPSFSSHLRDTTEVVRRMPELAGVPAAGLLGARVGGTVAATVADAEGCSLLVLVAPIVDGGGYVNEQIRYRMISELVKASGDTDGATVEDARRHLAEGGTLSIKGWPLQREVYEELSRVDLLERLGSFRGQALIVQVSRGGAPKASLRGLHDRLEALGARVTTRVVTDPSAPHFGYEHFQSADRDTLADSLGDLNEALTGAVGEWVEGVQLGDLDGVR